MTPPSPAALLWLAATVAVYLVARRAHARTRRALLNPALVSIAVLAALLVATRRPYEEYAAGTTLLARALGPAVVALGVPLAGQLRRLRHDARAVAAGLAAGCVVGMAVAIAVGLAAGASPLVLRSLAPRSATTPIAVAVTARLGGIPALSAAVSILTGVLGAVAGPALLRRAGVRSRLAAGLALGAAAHGIGTARAADDGEADGAAGGLAMGLNGLGTALLAPALVAAAAWLCRGRL